ncbi:FirrV-1-A17 [Feldmannia irregularis virus a]|uniref:FirrV-1-A17 n=1 Tax=Feldmannia irregularis virus a TaxID=231992 RepID=Q6XM70_9PHYC|nr:FirrV-1-A17 [Feldmannia irregularis virus a]AAR26841.1 FirrV-1-A17 [Feldmannia irregularis virus a]
MHIDIIKQMSRNNNCHEFIENPHKDKSLPSFDAQACRGRIRHGGVKRSAAGRVMDNVLYRSKRNPETKEYEWKYHRNLLPCKKLNRRSKDNPTNYDATNCPGIDMSRRGTDKQFYVSVPEHTHSDKYSWIPREDYRQINNHYKHIAWAPSNCFSDLSSGDENLFEVRKDKASPT